MIAICTNIYVTSDPSCYCRIYIEVMDCKTTLVILLFLLMVFSKRPYLPTFGFVILIFLILLFVYPLYSNADLFHLFLSTTSHSVNLPPSDYPHSLVLFALLTTYMQLTYPHFVVGTCFCLNQSQSAAQNGYLK